MMSLSPKANVYDAVVIGAGAIGSSVAYHLCARGMKVALVDKGDIGGGTSSHCDTYAQLSDKQPGFDTEQGQHSIAYTVELAKKFSYDVELAQRGTLWISESEEELEVAERYVKKQQANGVNMRMVDKKELHEWEPYLRKDIPGGHWSPLDTSINPYRLCFAYVDEAKRIGLDVFLYEGVKEIKRNSDGAVGGVVTAERELITKNVINCAGVWAPMIGEMVGINIPIIPRKGVILITEATFPIVKQKVQEFGYMATKFGDTSYTRHLDPEVERCNVSFIIEQTVDRNLMIGGSRSFTGYDTKSDIETVRAIARRAVQMMPILKNINCLRAYAGIRPYVDDHLPILSDVHQVPGFYIAAGHEGDGISLSAITGKMMAQYLFGESTDLDISKMSFTRFA
jgi:sarcosine oxidase subunit beta